MQVKINVPANHIEAMANNFIAGFSGNNVGLPAHFSLDGSSTIFFTLQFANGVEKPDYYDFDNKRNLVVPIEYANHPKLVEVLLAIFSYCIDSNRSVVEVYEGRDDFTKKINVAAIRHVGAEDYFRNLLSVGIEKGNQDAQECLDALNATV